MVEKSNESFKALLDVTRKEKMYFKEDMMNVFKVARDNFENITEENKEEKQQKAHDLLNEAKIFLEQVDIRKDEYIQTMINSI